MLMQQARALVPASGFSEVIDWAPVSDDGQLKVMLWLKGQGQSLHEADDRVDEANPLRLDEQRFWDYCKRRSAQRASIDLKRQVFMKKIDNTTSAGSTTVTRPAPVPYHAPDQCQVVPWAWNLAKGGGSEATLAVLELTTEVHSAFEVRESLTEKEQESVKEADFDLEDALAGQPAEHNSLTTMLRNLPPSAAPSIAKAIASYDPAPDETEKVRNLVETASPKFLHFVKLYEHQHPITFVRNHEGFPTAF
ncbi:hypothetical protein A1Q2_03765 [Trichosporon asahii var. asahii CBS 8904]|uniref:Uncharacterized protein n=1 Tax=Trichosporon asahii var. asahii (strain CBS 8904) TaxID=1220162 RepID=K1VMM1_TRIAC|nr:hypothetical protein A1Q2_03765 [Trichosporon asahii var. asahii CBS 8904]